MKTILVTGGAGFIGSHACKALANAGYLPISYDSLEHGHKWAVRWGPLEQGDIRDNTRVFEVLKKYQPIAVMHFAAYAYVGESVKNPGRYYQNNVAGTLSLLEAMRQANIKDIVFSSTCATYGNPTTDRLTESHPQNPINPYGRSKLMIEKILSDYADAYDFKYLILRYFNAAGADPEGETGEVHEPETHLIPLAIKAALGNGGPLCIFGGDYDTPDGTAIRDYIHVTDLASAHVLALGYLEQGRGERVEVNLGTGRGCSVRKILETVDKALGKKVPHIVSARREGDPPSLVADASKATRLLGWKPAYPDISKIIEDACNWELRAD
jgi:UDP-arabinose 4-epimerase